MKIIDLTHLFTSEMPVFPGDRTPSLSDEYDTENDILHYFVSTGMHVGTHMDGPVHMVKGANKLSDININQFFADGHVIDVRGKLLIDNDAISAKAIKEGDCVLFYTGWDADYQSGNYFKDYPILSESLANELVSLKIKFIGTDTCSPDDAPYKIHRVLLSNEILILENLTNLGILLEFQKFEIIALPAKFNSEAAPVRVVARIIE